MTKDATPARDRQRVRYAVIGLGHIAQVAVLPAFKNAARNSVLTALVSGDQTKLKQLSRRYHAPHTYSYENFDECVKSGEVDAVYIALPNSLHAKYAVRAAEAGLHVLCEKPLAVTEKDCLMMIRAARANRIKLMTAYRLHFEEANLHAIEIARSGRLGELRFFNSVFSMQVAPGNIRTNAKLGGGTLYDLGIYCINAARHIFRDEPTEVFAASASRPDRRFKNIDEMTSAVLRFPRNRLANFISSFGAADAAAYEIVGTKGMLRVDPSYEYAFPLKYRLTIDGKTTTRTFSKRDQFAPELLHFSDCIIRDSEPEPSAADGLADVRLIQALYRSASSGRAVKVRPVIVKRRPTLQQEIRRPAVGKARLVKARSASL